MWKTSQEKFQDVTQIERCWRVHGSSPPDHVDPAFEAFSLPVCLSPSYLSVRRWAGHGGLPQMGSYALIALCKALDNDPLGYGRVHAKAGSPTNRS